MKYNKSQIMKKAHKDYANRTLPCYWQECVIYKGVTYLHTEAPFGYFLSFAWFCAKKDAGRAEKEARERAERLASRKQFNGGAAFEGYYFKLWEKGDMRRIYISGYKMNGAWIDANTREIHCKRDETRALAERFMEAYEIAA